MIGIILSTFLLAAPASASSVWIWTTDDGVQSFTDKVDNIPEKYRSSAKEYDNSGITAYAKYTPSNQIESD
jgi:hypothetical protein